jgi:hypothetical protein
MSIIEELIHLKVNFKLDAIYQKCYNIINLILLVFEKSLKSSNENIILGINLIQNELKSSMK